jgi:quinoprotein glucose dehydrogenase
VPGEEAWPTQPFPTRPPPLVRQATYEADLTNITPESRASALEQFKRYKTGFLYTPASLRGTLTTPGHQGGVEWGGGAFDPVTRVLYVNANEAPTINRLEPLESDDEPAATPVLRGARLYARNCTYCHGFHRSGNPPLYPPLTDLKLDGAGIRSLLREGRGIMPAFGHFSDEQLDDLVAYLQSDVEEIESGVARGSTGAAGSIPRYAQISPFFEDPHGVPAISPPWGTLNAIDLDKGEILWKVPLGEYPQLVAKGIRDTGAKNFGGPVLTAGGVIFIAATPDEKIRAFDKYSGRVLWEHALPAGGYATPSVYEIDGRQFVVIACGGGGKLGTRHGESILAFALPDTRDGRPSGE